MPLRIAATRSLVHSRRRRKTDLARSVFFVSVLAALLSTAACVRTEVRTVSRADWFTDCRFGMFVHWGIYSLLGRGEWVMHNEKIPVPKYEQLVGRFDPTGFNADEWAAIAKRAGMGYITVTSKHHDGFCMFKSELTDYDSWDAPVHRDFMTELAEACEKNGLRLCFYYSPLDWHHPDYNTDWDSYVEYYRGQVRELCGNYGDIGYLWFDGIWSKRQQITDHTEMFFHWGLDRVYGDIRRLRPNALIANNHHMLPFPGEDFQTFEQDLPGENVAGFNQSQRLAFVPGETCLTINDHWGYAAGDDNHKSPETLIRYLAVCASRGANLLLNVGPTPEGKIIPEHVERLEAIGDWLAINDEAIYGTVGSPIGDVPWGAVTRSKCGERAYLHVFPWPGEKLEVEGLSGKVLKAWYLDGGEPVEFRQSDEKLELELRSDPPDPIDTVVALEME